MIQLRWITRKVSLARYSWNPVTGETKALGFVDPEDFRWDRVLQYRQKHKVSRFTVTIDEWGPWRDVPDTGIEQSDAAADKGSE